MERLIENITALIALTGEVHYKHARVGTPLYQINNRMRGILADSENLAAALQAYVRKQEEHNG